MPRLIIMIGAAGAGKSTWADAFVKENENFIIHSSDKIREEICDGDISYQRNKNKDVFIIMNQRTINDLKAGKNVIYDATNINRDKRKDFIREVRSFVSEVSIEAVFIKVSLDTALEQNAQREGKARVPDDVVFRMHRYLAHPRADEGWDRITVVEE